MSLAVQRTPVDRDPAHEKYLVHNRLDVLSILRALAAHAVTARVWLPGEREPVSTRLLAVKPQYEELVFDGNGIAALGSLNGEGTLTAEAAYDYIHLSFSAEHVESTVFRGAPAFRCRIPKTVARMQRRKSVRFPVPAVNPPMIAAEVGGRPVNLRVNDISLGGVSLVLEDPALRLAANDHVDQAALHLPGLGAVQTGLDVMYVDALPDGAGTRLGCRFSNIGPLELEHVRAYVGRLERHFLDSRR